MNIRVTPTSSPDRQNHTSSPRPGQPLSDAHTSDAPTSGALTSDAPAFGARIDGVDLSTELDAVIVAELRAAWLRYQVVYFPDQKLDPDALQRFTARLGPFGEDPYVAPLATHKHVLEVKREPDEQATPFGSNWHSDWSFQATPPSATLLHAKIVPPIGGDTLYADGCAAYEQLEPGLQETLEHVVALHSARRPYSHEGFVRGGGHARSMSILPSESAWQVQEHPVVRTHPETGRRALWINPVYTIGLTGMPEMAANDLLQQLFQHMLRPEFIYRHKWQPDMLTLWDNRSVLHCAQGGYDGYARLMHRTTVAGDVPA